MARRRRFQPSALVAGLLFLAVAAGFGGEAAGAWRFDPMLTLPAVCGLLVLSGVTAMVTRAARGRSTRPASGDDEAAPN